MLKRANLAQPAHIEQVGLSLYLSFIIFSPKWFLKSFFINIRLHCGPRSVLCVVDVTKWQWSADFNNPFAMRDRQDAPYRSTGMHLFRLAILPTRP